MRIRNRVLADRLGQIGEDAQTKSPEAAVFADAAIKGTISAGSEQGQGKRLPTSFAGVLLKMLGFKEILFRMRIVAITNCPVRLSFLEALLRDAGVETLLLDGHVSAVEGSIGAIPRRLAVSDDDERQALRVLREAGE